MVKATVNSSTHNRVSINADDRQAIRVSTLPPASSSDTTAREYANGAWTTANSALITANSAYNKANAANVLANSSYTFANTVNAIAVAAFEAANSGASAASAYDKANAANSLAFSAYGFANTVNIRTVASFAQSNIALLTASSAYDKANAVNLYVDTVNSNVTAAFAKANNALANTDGIHTAGRLNVSNHLVVFGNITTSQTVTAQHFDNVSDETLKENIHTILVSTSVLDKLNPVSFNWKSSGELSYGLIAQEVENILPQIVHTSGNIKTVSYIQLIAFLIAAVKDLQEQINSINTKL